MYTWGEPGVRLLQNASLRRKVAEAELKVHRAPHPRAPSDRDRRPGFGGSYMGGSRSFQSPPGGRRSGEALNVLPMKRSLPDRESERYPSRPRGGIRP